jgi:2-keto-4-pentenoate hydratase
MSAVNAPVSEVEPDGVARGLEAQFAALSAKRARGIDPIGWKIGLNAAPVQRHLGLLRPVIGHLTTASLIEPGSMHSLEGGVHVGVEPEVAIRIGADGSIDSLGPAIEVVDLDPAITGLEPILAANVYHRGVVLGPPAEGVGPADLEGLIATVIRNGEVEQRATFEDAGDDPIEITQLAAERLALVGEELREGQVIIAGSLTPIVFVEPGDSIEAELGPLGALGLSFA